MTYATMTVNQQNAIDKAIAAAKARAEAKRAAIAEGKTSDEPKSPVVKAAKVAKAPVDKAAREAERLAAKQIRDAARVEKKALKATEKALKDQDRAPAHMSKVEKAGASLPQMDDTTLSAYDLVRTGDLTEGQLAILVAHLGHYNRVRATIRSATCTKLEVGQTVEIVASDRDPRIIGKKGVVSQVRKIRVMVSVPGLKKDAYLFVADVAPYTAVEEAPITESPANILDEVPAEATIETVEPEATEDTDFLAPDATGTDDDA